MKFEYNRRYYSKHSSWFDRYPKKLRNRCIVRETSKYISSGNFLEIGFGDDNLIKLYKNQFNVFGIDISEYAVSRNIQKYNSENFKVCDISKEKIPFDKSFDLVCAINTIEHIANVEFAFRNIYNSLSENGIFVVYLSTNSNIISRIQYKMMYNAEEHIYRPSIKLLRKLLEESGFILCKEYAASFLPIRISNRFILESFNLCFALWKKQ